MTRKTTTRHNCNYRTHLVIKTVSLHNQPSLVIVRLLSLTLSFSPLECCIGLLASFLLFLFAVGLIGGSGCDFLLCSLLVSPPCAVDFRPFEVEVLAIAQIASVFQHVFRPCFVIEIQGASIFAQYVLLRDVLGQFTCADRQYLNWFFVSLI